MLNKKDFEDFPNQSYQTKMFILKMVTTVLLEDHLLRLQESFNKKEQNDFDIENKINNAIEETKSIINLIEHEEKKNDI